MCQNHDPSISIWEEISASRAIIKEWDAFGSKELYEKNKYLYCLSVVLSEFFRSDPNSYDYQIVYDLLSGEKNKQYTREQFNFFLADLKKFTNDRAETTTYYEDENKALIEKFDTTLPRFASQDHFDRLKSHWLRERIHRPILAVLKIRAEEWSKDAPNQTTEDILDILY